MAAVVEPEPVVLVPALPVAEPEVEGAVVVEPALGEVVVEPALGEVVLGEVVEPEVEGRVVEPEPLADGVDVVEPVEGVVAEPDELVEPEAEGSVVELPPLEVVGLEA